MISKWETGYQAPQISTLKCLAEILGVSLDYLNGVSHNSDLDNRSKQFELSTMNTSINTMSYENNIVITNDEQTVLELYKQLDANDKGEIKGEMKQMLKADKYKSDMVKLRLLARGGEYIEEVSRKDLIKALEKDRNNTEPIPDDIF